MNTISCPWGLFAQKESPVKAKNQHISYSLKVKGKEDTKR